MRKNKELLQKIEQKQKELLHLQNQCITLLERIDDAHRNGKIVLLEDLDENVINKFMDLARDDRTIIFFSKNGNRIEIHEKEEEKLKKRKNLF